MSIVVAALATLLTVAFGGTRGLVLCVGSDGHRALEVEHTQTVCPTLAASQSSGTSVAPAPQCLDVPTGTATSLIPPSGDSDAIPTPPLVASVDPPEPAEASLACLHAAIDTPATALGLIRQLRSTILLV